MESGYGRPSIEVTNKRAYVSWAIGGRLMDFIRIYHNNFGFSGIQKELVSTNVRLKVGFILVSII